MLTSHPTLGGPAISAKVNRRVSTTQKPLWLTLLIPFKAELLVERLPGGFIFDSRFVRCAVLLRGQCDAVSCAIPVSSASTAASEVFEGSPATTTKAAAATLASACQFI